MMYTRKTRFERNHRRRREAPVEIRIRSREEPGRSERKYREMKKTRRREKEEGGSGRENERGPRGR